VSKWLVFTSLSGVKITQFIAHGSGDTEPKPNGTLSPNNSRLSDPKKIDLFRAYILTRRLLQVARDLSIRAVEKT
jgi:hypothetical protein